MMSRGRERAAVLKRTEFVVKDVVEYMLKENGVRVNGYTSVLAGKVRDVSNEDACIRDDDFLRAREQIMTCCKFMKREYGRELAKMCKKLNVEDEQLHTNFLEVMNEIWGEESARNWGRLVSMLVAAYYICDRLHREESKDKAKAKIDSVIGWLSDYMKKNAVPWITDHGGYVREPSVCRHCWWVFSNT